MPSVSVRFSSGALTPKGELSNSAVAFKATVRKALIHLGLAGSVEEVELMVDVDRYCADENVEPVRVCVELMEVVFYCQPASCLAQCTGKEPCRRSLSRSA